MEILQDIATKIGFDWRLAITHLINFLIIFFLLVKFALPAIKKTVNERTKRIQEGLRMRDEADKIVSEATQKGAEITKEASLKAEGIVSRSEVSSKEILLNANSKASEIVANATKQQDESKEKGLKEAESILTKDLGKILAKISTNSFDGKISAEVNNDFISKTFKENF